MADPSQPRRRIGHVAHDDCEQVSRLAPGFSVGALDPEEWPSCVTILRRAAGTSGLREAMALAAAMRLGPGCAALVGVGTFVHDERGMAALPIDASLDGIGEAMITVEAEGGSQAPSDGEVIMQGELPFREG